MNLQNLLHKHIAEQIELTYGLEYIRCDVTDCEDGTILVYIRTEDSRFTVGLDLSNPQYIEHLIETINAKTNIQ